MANDYLYYPKNIYNIATLINELLGSKIAKFIDLQAVYYEMCRLHSKTDRSNDGQFALMSKNFRKLDCEYLDLSDLGIDHEKKEYSDEEILSILRSYCYSDIEYQQLLLELSKLCILDIYCAEQERNEPGNMLFEKSSYSFTLGPVFDCERSFFRDKDAERYHYNNGLIDIDINQRGFERLFKI